ncbi:MAG TPA: hypothetical protein VHC97_12920 [Thermoanaerobaculia bacterium]|nr:hypothetical protein [Thermoanaerobaculia bacterium]
MTRPMIRKLAIAAAATALVTASIAYALTQMTLPSNAGSSCATSLTPAEFNAWFDAGVVSLNGAVKPANSVLFPDTPNCSFYEWSEQMFLWLTSPAPPRYGGGGGLIMNTSAFYDVTPPDAMGHRQFVPHSSGFVRAFTLRASQKGILGLPVTMEKGSFRLLEILPTVTSREGLPMVADQNGNQIEVAKAIQSATGKPILLDPTGREIQGPRAILQPVFARKIESLGPFDRTELIQRITVSQAVLSLDLFGNFPETEQGQADGNVLMAQNGSLVYYALTVNNVFALYRTMLGASVPAGTKFPVTQADLDAITNFAAANGQPPVIDSEALAIEIKTSWIESSSLADASTFIQMKAIVPVYDTSDPNDWVQTGTTTKMLAMVGMHVVGSTGSTNPANNVNHGHPEMLWATFEHLSNDPSAAYTYNKTPSGTGSIPQNTTGDWLFTANGSAGPFNQPHIQLGGSGHILSVSPFTISPSDTLRVKPFGMDGTSSLSNAEVISLNNTVRSLLDPADVRRNYFHEGTTWTIFGASPTPSSNQVGTKKLSNTTMETYTQGGNCFNCHGTNTTAVSHIFDDTDPLF